MRGQTSEHFVLPESTQLSQDSEQLYGTYWERFFARLIDTRLSLLIVPIVVNLIMYFEHGQTIGYKILGLKIRPQGTPYKRPTLRQLISRSASKVLITLSAALLFVATLALVMKYIVGNPLPQGSVIWIFLFAYLLLGTIITFVSMIENKKNKSVYDTFGETVVVKTAISKSRKIIAYSLCSVATICIFLLGYIGTYMLLELGSFYVEDTTYKGRLQTTKRHIQSPLTQSKFISDTTIFISYYFDPYGSYKGYATPSIRLDDEELDILHNTDDLSKKIEIVEQLEDPREVNERLSEDNVDEDGLDSLDSDSNDEAGIEDVGGEEINNYPIPQPSEEIEAINARPVKETETTPRPEQEVQQPPSGELPTVDDVLIANEKRATSSLWYILELPQVGRVFTHSHSDDKHAVTQVHSLLGDQEIRINDDGLFIKDSITPWTKLTTDGSAKDDVQYMYSRKALLPLLRQSTLEGISTLNGNDVYMFTTKTRDSYPLLITQHLGNEEIDEVLLTFYVDVESLRLVGGTVVVVIGENRFEGILSISYDVEPPKVNSPLGYIKKYLKYLDSIFKEFPTFGRFATS